MSTVSYCRILNRPNHSMSKTIKSAGIIVVWYLVLATTVTRGQVQEQYIGCFVDNIHDQQWVPVLTNQSDFTIEICIQKCHNETNRIKSETTYAALANGRECICRNNSGQELRDRNCNAKCSGDQMQNCGGSTQSRFYSLYSVCRIGYFGRKCEKLCHCKRHLPCDRKTGICPDGCEEQWIGTSCNISNIHKQYIGCYGDGRDHASTRAMDVKNPGGKTGYNRPTTNSIEFCMEICSTSAYTYAGMQYGYDCFCGEKYARYGNTTNFNIPNKEAICNFPCPANPSQICGGDFANSVYYVCPVGFYGRNCTDQCNCSDEGPCRFNGSCLCKSGETGSSCNVRVCPVGFYGRKCTDRCPCNGNPCQFNGSCVCKPGWTGHACNIRDCRRNNGDCGSDEMCESVDLGFAHSSMCRCKDRSFRDNNTCRLSQVHEQYIGCFVDNINDKQLKPVLKNQSDLTIEICIRKCHNETNGTQSEMTFAALANGRACICRNNSGQELRDRNCNVKCSGDQMQNCGGNTKSRFYSLYSVCRIGNFGPKCDQLCHCKRHLPCDRKTGTCPDGCEEQWIGTTCNISNIHKQYIGCYGDGARTTQAMDVKNPDGRTGHDKRNNSVEFCIEICSTRNYTYAGMQYGYDCFCGEKYARYGNKTCVKKEAICNFTCPANRNQTCGGDYANSVHYVCPVGFYGRNCVNRCPCNGAPCRFNGSCLCESGWTGFACNIRDCRSNNGDCGPDEMCESVDLGFANSSMCRCKDGSFRDNNTCRLNVDECTSGVSICNATSEKCVNNIGSYKCECKDGFVNTSGMCKDIDECRNGTIVCNEETELCENTIGSYRCHCKPGYESSAENCTDIDECRNGTIICDDETELCKNTIGSYGCQCKPGYENMTSAGNCIDVDECKSNTSSCNTASENCFNNIGSYRCECKDGFRNKSGQCEDKVCPDELDKEYSIHWSRTKAGTESYAPCPRNNSGTCSRECKSLGIDGNPLWSAPNCNGCFDKEFKELLEKVNKVNLTAFKNQTVIAKIASQLSTVTNKSEGLSPGNLNASVMMIKQLADLRTERTINANAMEIKSIVQAANNVLQPNNSKSWQELEEVNKNIATSILFSLDVYGRSLAALNTSDHSIEVEDSLVLEAWSFEKSNLREIEFPNGSLWDENRGDGISISVEAFKNSMSSESPSALHMWGSYYRTVNDYLPGNEGGTDDVNSRVLSFSIDGLKTNERLNRPVLITLRHNQEKRTSFQRTCAFWNFSGGNWDSVGCSVTSTNLTHTICSCDHLTNFAILMSLEPKEDWLLSLISIIGCSISVAALILTIFVYALTWKQAKSAQATVLLNLCVALIIAYIIFMVGADKVHSKGFSKIGCQAVAVLLHYFFLAAFFIMLAEGVELLLYIIFVFHVRRTRETVMLVISAWVLPLIVLGVSLGSTKLEGYGHEKACWLSSENHLIWAFVGPVLGIIAANFVILIIVLRWRSQKKALLSKNVKKRDEINATIWNLAVTCPVLGLGWLFGFLTLAFDHTVFQYMFVAVNSVQGLLIFIFHALFHNKRVNERISSLFSTYICSRCRNSDQAVITQSTSSSQDQPTKKADKKGGAPRGGMGKQGNVRGHGTQLTSFGDSETMESTQ